MSTKNILISALVLLFAFNSCMMNKEKTANTIEGSWVNTEETSWKFSSGTQKVFMNIQKDQEDKLTSRVIFIWNDEYQSEWILKNEAYDNLNNITIEDMEGNSYHAHFNPVNNTISGVIYSSEDNSSDSLIFVPSGKDLEIAMLYPRPADANGNERYTYKQPEQLNDFLNTASIYNEGIDSSLINRLIQEMIDQKYGRIESFLVLKDNKLILEEYFYGYDNTKTHKFNSCTKSITSLLLGIALDEHPQVDLEQSIFDFIPQYDALKTTDKKKITLKHFLTMSTGLDWREWTQEFYEADDRINYVLSKPLIHTPGEHFQYNSGNTFVIGSVISSLLNSDVQDFADSTLFKPLGIEEYSWRKHTTGELEYWYGLSMKPRDMAKIGLLVQNEGKWNDIQLVSKDWIIASTKPTVQESDFFNYGYQWWIRSEGCKKWWKDAFPESLNDSELIVALGAGGNYLIIVNELNMVIVTTATNYNNDKAFSVFPLIIERIIPALKKTE